MAEEYLSCEEYSSCDDLRNSTEDAECPREEQLEILKLENVESTGKELGRGSYGVVSELVVNGLKCAGKSLHKIFFSGCSISEQNSMREKFLEECVQHAGLRHPNIVQLIGVFFSPGDPVPTLVLEFLHDSLYGFLKMHPDVPVPFKHRILLDVAVGLQFLHERTPPIIHRDLTPKNVLLTEDLRAKISDMGVARILPSNCLTELTKAPGNIEFMPPEALVPNVTYDSKLDIFSLGVLILYTVLQEWPSPSKGATSADPCSPGKVIGHSEVERREPLFDKMDPSDELTTLAKDCLNNDSTLRPTIQEIHALFESLVARSVQFHLSPLEWYQRHKKVEEEKKSLKKQVQATEGHIRKLLLDLSDREVLNEHEIRELVGQLQSMLHETSERSGGDFTLGGSGQQHKLVVGFKASSLSSFESESNISPTSSGEDLLHLCSPAGSLHPFSLTLSRSVSHTFTGTFVKTVVSGLRRCFGLASRKGFLYVVDEQGWKGIHICDVTTGDVRSVVDSASKLNSLTGTPIEMCWFPSGIAVDDDDNLILADKSNHRITKYTNSGDFLKSSGESTAGNEKGKFYEPISLCVTKEGKIIVCDWKNHRLQVLNSDLRCERVFGKEGKGDSEFLNPRDVAVDSKGNIYVVDCGHYCVKVFNSNFEYLHKFGREGHIRDGFRWPNGLCIDSRGYVYVTDRNLNCVKVFDTNGTFKMEFGGKPFDPDVLKFDRPSGITVDEDDHVFVSDSNRGRVQMFV